MALKDKEGEVVFAFNGKWISWIHTMVAYAAFFGALFTGMALHYKKIVQNEYYGYPVEWFPSVSSTIGDRYPERSVFQVFIAITSGPRFALVMLWFVLTARSNSTLPKFVFGVGMFRTITCGGWTYVTSTDDHNWHDIFMVSYLVATIPWTVGCLALSPNNAKALKYRKMLASCFFGTLVPMLYFFIQHKVHKVPGAYTIYALFEWALVLFDVGFDAVTALDFEGLELIVKDVKGLSRGGAQSVVDNVREKEKDTPLGKALDQPFSWNDALDAVADVYNGFVFWSMLTSLGLVIWYFPLWYMGLSGYEAFVMSTISPILLAVGPLRSIAVQNVRTVHLLSLSGLLAYAFKSPELRLSAVGFGVAMSCIAWTASWYAERSQPARLQNRAVSWVAGLIASSVAKFAFWTNNPVWPVMHGPNGGWNKLGICIAVVAILRSTRQSATNSGGFEPSGRPAGSSFFAACGLAGMVFGLHALLSDSSTMILWVWEGFPVRGPIAAHGVVTITAMCAGLASNTMYREKITIRTKFALIVVGAFLVTAFKHWTGYAGALALAFGLPALAPELVASAARYNPAMVFGLGFFLYNLMVLAHVWTVAYAFVPGGPILREHTDYVQTAMVVLIGLGVLGLPDIGRSSKMKGKPKPYARLKSTYYIYALAGLELLAISFAYLRFPTNDYVPYHKDDKVITAGIWTIHFSIDNDMYSSERRMRDLIRDSELDVIGLLESDTQRIIMGNRDITQYIAEDLGMYVDFGPGPNKHTWGAALLSKFPIVNSTHHLTPSPVGELAPVIHATLDAYGEYIDVFVFHSGQEEDPEDRRLQSEYLAKLMHETPRPAILLSYLVTKPLEGNYHTYVGEKSGMKDIDATDWDRWCEYILYKGLRRSGYARISRSTITDTELQVGKFIVGQPENGIERIDESQVPEGQRFPALLKGEGVRDHRYHVFDEPRYFA